MTGAYRPGCYGQQLSLFSSQHRAATLFLSSIRYKKCSKCVFAYTIIIIQSRAAFNPCCLFYTKKIVFFAQKAELFVNKCLFSRKKPPHRVCAAALYQRDVLHGFRVRSGHFHAEIASTLPRWKTPLERAIFLTGSQSSAPEPAPACARDKRRSRHTGKACCFIFSAAKHPDTKRWSQGRAIPPP